MMTVVDQVRPWFTPSSTLAKMIQPQLGAQIKQERHGQADEPAGDEDGLAADAIRERAGEEVGDRLHRAERDDEGQRGGEGGEAEHAIGEQRQHGAFLADHPADERVDADEQRELAEVLAQTRAGSGAGVAVVGHASISSGVPVAVGPVVGPPARTRDVVRGRVVRGCWRRSWRVRRDRTSR